jgi:threonine dehydrogenase-like Zn-dependent dehydrogenase
VSPSRRFLPKPAVTAAAGGVGRLAVQLARALGAGRIIGTVSDSSKAAFVVAQDPDEVVLSNEPTCPGETDAVIETALLAAGRITPAIAAELPLTQAGLAYDLLATEPTSANRPDPVARSACLWITRPFSDTSESLVHKGFWDSETVGGGV